MAVYVLATQESISHMCKYVYMVQTLNGMHVCYRVKTQNVCACVPPHIATCVSFCSIINTNLWPLSINYMLSYPFFTHLNIPNDAENIWIIISLMRQESNA